MTNKHTDEIQQLLDKQAIAELVFNYSRAVDRKDFALLRTLYAEDGYDDHGGLFRGPANDYVDWLEQAMRNCDITTHSVQNHLIAITGADTAEGEVYVTAYHRLHDGKGSFNDLVEGLRYIDQYRKTDGRWQFVRRTLINDWAQVAPSYWDLEDPALKGTPVGRADPDDLSYAKLSHATFRRR